MANIEPYGVPLMTQEEFEAATNGRRFSQENKELARAVLCGGSNVATVANDNGVARQQLHRVVDAILQAHLKETRYPSDWIKATVVGPAEDVNKFRASMEQKLRKLRSKK